MRIEYHKDYSSIGPFDAIELPDFAVLTGVNGSGKTHLLRAIKAGHVTVDAIHENEIGYYSYENFVVGNASGLDSQSIGKAVNSSWSLFIDEPNGGKQDYRSRLRALHRSAFVINENGASVDLLEVDLPRDASIWEAHRDPTGVSDRLAPRIARYVASVRQEVFRDRRFRKIPFYASIIKALTSTPRNLHLLTKEEFAQRFAPTDNYPDGPMNPLACSLGTLFTKYHRDQFDWAIRKWDEGTLATSKEDLCREYEDSHERPWKLINEVLASIRDFAEEESAFNFAITEPVGGLTMENWQAYSFSPQLIDNNDGGIRDFRDLSSGEQTLLALAVSVFESRNDFALPELLLLDEVDASLHPSMTRALLRSIRDVFLSRGTKVILATHSPSTIALAPPDSVYLVQRGKPRKKLEPKSNKDAMELLTEGFATLEQGLAIFNEFASHDFCVISEGRNANYLKKALLLHGQTDVEVVRGLEAVTGKEQLKTLFRLFCAAPISKPVLFIWDCDVTYNLEDGENAHSLILPKNPSNAICPKGIENMFPVHLFSEFLSQTVDSQGKLTKTFDSKRKREFEEHVLRNATATDFASFQAVVDKINQIRSAS